MRENTDQGRHVTFENNLSVGGSEAKGRDAGQPPFDIVLRA